MAPKQGPAIKTTFSVTIGNTTYKDTDALLAYRKNLYAKSFKQDNKKIKKEIVSIAKKFSNILDREVAKALGGKILRERAGRGVQPDVIFDDSSKTTEIKGIGVTLDSGGRVTKASKIAIAGGSKGINLSTTKRIATSREGLVDDSKTEAVNFARGGSRSLISRLVAAKDDNEKLKEILSGSGAAAKLRKNFMMKSGDIRIPVTVPGANPEIRAIRFPWKAIKANNQAKIKITEAADGVFFQIYFTEAYVRNTINNANKAASTALTTYSQELARELANTHAALSPSAIKYLEIAGVKVDFIIDKGSALIGAGKIKKAKEENNKSPQQSFISGVQLSALVRQRLAATMDKTGAPNAPFLKYRSGRFVSGVQVFPNYRKGLIRYTLNPLYRSLEDYGYTPDVQVITSIRQVVQSLYTRQFNIMRAI